MGIPVHESPAKGWTGEGYLAGSDVGSLTPARNYNYLVELCGPNLVEDIIPGRAM